MSKWPIINRLIPEFEAVFDTYADAKKYIQDFTEDTELMLVSKNVEAVLLRFEKQFIITLIQEIEGKKTYKNPTWNKKEHLDYLFRLLKQPAPIKPPSTPLPAMGADVKIARKHGKGRPRLHPVKSKEVVLPTYPWNKERPQPAFMPYDEQDAKRKPFKDPEQRAKIIAQRGSTIHAKYWSKDDIDAGTPEYLRPQRREKRGRGRPRLHPKSIPEGALYLKSTRMAYYIQDDKISGLRYLFHKFFMARMSRLEALAAVSNQCDSRVSGVYADMFSQELIELGLIKPDFDIHLPLE